MVLSDTNVSLFIVRSLLCSTERCRVEYLIHDQSFLDFSASCPVLEETLNSDGDTPNLSLKYLRKYLGDLKPRRSAVSVMVIFCADSKETAFSILMSSMNSLGVLPVILLSLLKSRVLDTPMADAKVPASKSSFSILSMTAALALFRNVCSWMSDVRSSVSVRCRVSGKCL